jgi:hypothetical protein
MLHHCVFLRFRADVPGEEIAHLLQGFRDLAGIVPGILAVRAGANVSPEGLDRGYRHGFTMDFVDEAARDAYLVHPDHLALAERVIAALEGGIDGVAAVDLLIA